MKKSNPVSGGIKLYDGDDSVTIAPARHTAKSRIEIATIAKDMPTVDDKTKTLMEQALKAQAGGASNEAAIAKLLEDGKLSIDDIVGAQTEDPETAKKKTDCVISMFRVCANIPDDWEERVNDDEFMYEQDITEVEKFVASFRQKVGA